MTRRAFPVVISGGRLLLTSGLAVALITCTVERGDVRTPGGQPPEADTTRIRTVLEGLAGAFSGDDIATLRSLIADDLTFIVDGMDGRGADAAIDSLAAARDRLGRPDLTLTSVNIELADGETAWVVCRFDLDAERAGATLVREGRVTLILERREGEWTLVHVHLTQSTAGRAM